MSAQDPPGDLLDLNNDILRISLKAEMNLDVVLNLATF